MKHIPFLQQMFFLTAGLARRGFEHKTKHTTRVQTRFLHRLISDYRDTAFGRHINLAACRNVDDFRRKIPVQPYSAYEPFIDRIWQGEQNVLTPDPVIYLTASSGTTGKRKLIPVTRQSHSIRNRARRASTGFFGAALQQRGGSLGHILLTNAALIAGHSPGGTPYGTASAGDLVLNKRGYSRHNLFAHPFDTFFIADGAARHYVSFLFALVDRRTSFLTGNFPPHVLHGATLLNDYSDDLIRDIEQGRISDKFPLPNDLRRTLMAKWSANPARAAELRGIQEREGCLTPKAVWPDLSVIVTARGAPSHFHFKKFNRFFGGTPIFGGVYGSTESMFGVYHNFDSDQAVLTIDTAFYEFVPESQWDKEFPDTLQASEVEEGQCYRVLVTNHAGLIRYDIGDVVKINGFFNTTPTLTFIRRKGGPISSFSEKTTEAHVDHVLSVLQERHSVLLEDFCVTLSDQEIPARYLLNIELCAGEILNQPQQFINDFDKILMDTHERYKVRRGNFIPPPKLRVLKTQSFADLRSRLTQGPGTDTNVKIKHTSDDRNYLSGLVVRKELESEISVAGASIG